MVRFLLECGAKVYKSNMKKNEVLIDIDNIIKKQNDIVHNFK